MNIVAMKSSAAIPNSALEKLSERRAAVEAQLRRLNVIDERSTAADNALAAVKAEIVALDKSESEKFAGWASAGKGEPPPLAIAERKALIERRMSAEAEVEAARSAVVAIHGRRQELANDVQRIDREAFAMRVATLGDDYEDIRREYAGMVDKFRGVWLDLAALPLALAEYGRDNHADRGDADGARPFLQMVERLRAAPIPPAEPAGADILQAVARWKAIIAQRVAS